MKSARSTSEVQVRAVRGAEHGCRRRRGSAGLDGSDKLLFFVPFAPGTGRVDQLWGALIAHPSPFVTELESQRCIRFLGLEGRVAVVLDLVLQAADEAAREWHAHPGP